jgi:glucose/mannose-6-phosphate isomerase
MNPLDGPHAMAGDSLGLVDEIGRSLAAFDEARAAAEAVTLIFPPGEVRDVAICGMGGSAIAGDLVAGAYSERLRVPVTVVRDYWLPGWVGPNTLAILSSYSGGTEETLTCASQALDRESLCVAVTSGGKLGSQYAEEGVAVVPVAPGLQPRAALLRMLAPLLVLLERCEVLPPIGSEMEEARETLREAVATYGPDTPERENPAKQLARALHGGVPVVWGAELTAAVARRWAAQFNENSKLPAQASRLPELDHNEIVGFAGTPPDMSKHNRLVMLRDPRNHRQVQRRFDFTRELVGTHFDAVFSIEAEGQGALARTLDLVMLGDYVSLYLAILRGVDPGPVDIIERLKERLASTGFGRTAEGGPAGG